MTFLDRPSATLCAKRVMSGRSHGLASGGASVSHDKMVVDDRYLRSRSAGTPRAFALHWQFVKRVALAFVGIALLGAFASTLTGCSENRISLATGPREYVANDYPDVLKRWTRTGSLVNLARLDDLLTVTSTYESWDFRWAYVVRYAQDYRLTVDQRRKLLQATLDETRGEHQFYVALYGTQRRWTDLSRPTSSWIVRLIDELGNETAPSRIEAIVKPGALERTYFPYTSPWRQAFRVHFPRSTDGKPSVAETAKWFGLRFAGAEGNQELHWDVERTEDRVHAAAATVAEAQK